ncbi:polysaccharide deacetylase family protein [Lederbergia citri]|uniref:Polysaccharide deacetylase family protein n=1 Tax=Lederbergia citri TaxID=2833580 RepID=A0A942TGT9_9BACI|nr:polysaccharide deacetylase family protein [Lederbergia citri]MBS4197363.1 polysaccharide deacetylase family protein [Lederbergia citri]
MLRRRQLITVFVAFMLILSWRNTEYVKAVNQDPTNDGFKVPILMYHSIDEFKGNGYKELFITPENFEEQMTYLKVEGFTPITFDDITNLENIKKPILITLDDGYKNNMNAFHILKTLNDSTFQAKATIFMVGRKIDTKSGLSRSQLREMSDSGIISIQSHTETHPDLRETLYYRTELRDIKTKLEEITGREVTALAYPAGQYNDKVIEETKKIYQYAVTTKPGIANISESLYEMKRVRINNSTTLLEFKNLVNP